MKTIDILSQGEGVSEKDYHHEILVRGDFETCREKVLKFFKAYTLVRYSRVFVLRETSVCSSEPAFGSRLTDAEGKNRWILDALLRDLMKEGFTAFSDLGKMPQGYRSNMLHVITHFLDGFFGIDTYFFNLEEDSHWVSDEMTGKMKNGGIYWLISVEAGW